MPQAPSPFRERKRRSVLPELLPRVQGDPSGLARDESLVREMMETLPQAAARRARSLGDVKLLNAALRELRYAFKVFAPYRGVRKVSVFGSARTPPDDAAYGTAARVRAAHRRRAAAWSSPAPAAASWRAARRARARERSFGVNIRLPFEQEPNEFIPERPEAHRLPLLLHPQAHVHKEADARRALPRRLRHARRGLRGLTLVQTGQDERRSPSSSSTRRAALLEDAGSATSRTTCSRQRLISQDDMALFKVTAIDRRGGRGDHRLLPRLPLVALRRDETSCSG